MIDSLQTALVARPINFLLVDDDDLNAMIVRRALEHGSRGHGLWVANDGLEALALLRSGELPRHRRLVLLDLDMPRMNGLELLRALRADPVLRSTTVVVLS